MQKRADGWIKTRAGLSKGVGKEREGEVEGREGVEEEEEEEEEEEVEREEEEEEEEEE